MKRRGARRLALEILFEADISGVDASKVLGRLEEDTSKAEFAAGLVNGVMAHIEEIDSVIEKYAEDWSVSRMPAVDRNLLRMGVYELLYLPEIPVAVLINEAVELAKKYSTANSGKFINGLLDKVATVERSQT